MQLATRSIELYIQAGHFGLELIHVRCLDKLVAYPGICKISPECQIKSSG